MKLARIMAEQLQLVTFKPPVRFLPIEIAQYWHARFHRDAGHKWLRALSLELFADNSKRQSTGATVVTSCATLTVMGPTLP